MDFKALSYPPQEVTRLENILGGVQSFTCERTDSGVRLRWAAVAGQSYQVESTADLATNPWASFGNPVTGTEGWAEVMIPQSQVAAEARRFFRVKTQSP
jgi:hypothetical protein